MVKPSMAVGQIDLNDATEYGLKEMDGSCFPRSPIPYCNHSPQPWDAGQIPGSHPTVRYRIPFLPAPGKGRGSRTASEGRVRKAARRIQSFNHGTVDED